MVKVTADLPRHSDHSIDREQWLINLTLKQPVNERFKQACHLGALIEDQQTFFGESCFSFALNMASLVVELQLDQEAATAAIAYVCSQYGGLKIEDINEQLDNTMGQMITGIQRMDALAHLQNQHQLQQSDNLRRMLLAIVSDVRVVVIKLTEQLCIMRAIKNCQHNLQQELAEQTKNIYAPLANRLGIHKLKWELEDLSFYYLQPDIYKNIAKSLQQRRVEREKNINIMIGELTTLLKQSDIKADIYGRAKHIYSIYRKMQRKNVDFDQIYDAHAIRILVPSNDDCYTTLSMVHNTWIPISEEFDDYIQNPKANGYQSIHTVVIGPGENNFEIQIRTHQMHEDAEKGVAAHWVYKEGGQSKQQGGHEQQIAWLRQLLEWQKEVSDEKAVPNDLEKKIFEDRIYVFTPQGRIIDLPQGATPLDFAYTIHTEVGHRCRGAKIHGKIVPLTHTLTTGDQVEILTASKSQPSRDWLIIQRGYLKTARARAKVLSWFKQQDTNYHTEEGRSLLEREMNRLKLTANLDKIANQLNFKSSETMLTALGNSDIKMSQIINLINKDARKEKNNKADDIAPIHGPSKKKEDGNSDIMIYGVGGMVTKLAQCCKPVPGDPILGYVTIGHGVSIHRPDCKNITNELSNHSDRIIEVEWRQKNQQNYGVDIEVEAYDRSGLVRDITNTLANEKIHVRRLNTSTDQGQQVAKITLTIEIYDVNELGRILDRIHQLPNIYHAVRK